MDGVEVVLGGEMWLAYLGCRRCPGIHVVKHAYDMKKGGLHVCMHAGGSGRRVGFILVEHGYGMNMT